MPEGLSERHQFCHVVGAGGESALVLPQGGFTLPVSECVPSAGPVGHCAGPIGEDGQVIDFVTQYIIRLVTLHLK